MGTVTMLGKTGQSRRQTRDHRFGAALGLCGRKAQIACSGRGKSSLADVVMARWTARAASA
jgi:hypothetical protein